MPMLRLVLVALAAALALTGCGRRGPPETPAPDVIIMKPDDKPATRSSEDKPFLLDPLL